MTFHMKKKKKVLQHQLEVWVLIVNKTWNKDVRWVDTSEIFIAK